MENVFLDFEKNKVQLLNLEQLRATHKENDIYGNPLKGIYHYQLLDNIINTCKEEGYNVEIYDMFAAQNRDRSQPGVVILPQVEQQFGEKAVEAHILRRVFANIRLTNFDDDNYTTNIAVAFHQKGIQVGFGNMVKICHNQCMLNPDKYVSTYSEKGEGKGKGATIECMLQTIKEWLVGAHQTVISEREKIERMKEIEVTPEQIFTIIGMLTALRVKCDTSYKEIKNYKTYPLNQSQISQYTEDLLLKYEQQRRLTAWDLYNSATELYKASTMDIPSLLPQNRAMVTFLNEQFCLN